MIEYIIAVMFMLIFSYYDIFNNRIVPEWVSYSFLIASIITFALFPPLEIMKVVIALIVFLIGYLIYKIGYLGGADVFAITGLCLILPLTISNIPSIIILLLISMLLTMLYVMFKFLLNLKEIKFNKQDIITSLLWLVGYSALAYMIYNIGQTTIGIVVFTLGLINSLFALIKTNLMNSMIEYISLDKIIDEDILATDKMNQDFVKENKIERLLTKEQINKLKKLGIKEVPVYTKLPPYLPFVALTTLIIFGYLFIFN